MTFSLKTRILLYLYSTRNIVGCSLGLIGVALLFGGVIHEYWILITIGMYGIGALTVPAQPDIENRLLQSLSAEELLIRLEQLIQEAERQLTPETVRELRSITDTIEQLLPRLIEAGRQDDNLFTVRETIQRYLPETLSTYCKLPPLYRTTHVISDGKTARDLLTEQVTLIRVKLQEVLNSVSRGDMQALLSNGQFLRDRFVSHNFLEKLG